MYDLIDNAYNITSLVLSNYILSLFSIFAIFRLIVAFQQEEMIGRIKGTERSTKRKVLYFLWLSIPIVGELTFALRQAYYHQELDDTTWATSDDMTRSKLINKSVLWLLFGMVFYQYNYMSLAWGHYPSKGLYFTGISISLVAYFVMIWCYRYILKSNTLTSLTKVSLSQ